MKTNLSLVVLLALGSHSLFAQSGSRLLFSEKDRSVFPIMKLGFNYIKRSTGELGLLFGMNGRLPMDDARPFSILVHGPSIGLEVGKANHELLLAPKISYEVYSFFTACRFSITDYTYLSSHAIYATVEGGLTIVSIFNIWGGFNIPVDGENEYIPKGRFSVSLNIPLLIFRKDKMRTYNNFEN